MFENEQNKTLTDTNKEQIEETKKLNIKFDNKNNINKLPNKTSVDKNKVLIECKY